METIQFWANVATIVVGLLAIYKLLHGQIKQCEQKIDTVFEIINIKNDYNSQGAQYLGCTFKYYEKEVSHDQIEQEYRKGLNKEDKHA